MTQRLALHHILTTQLAKNWEQEEAAKARLARMSGRKDKVRSSLRSAHVPARYHSMMPDTRKTYDNMVERIHQTMQSVRPKRKPVPVPVPLSDTESPAGSPAEAPPLPSTLVSKHYPKRSRSGRVKGGATGHGSVSRSNLKPLALIRAGLNLKTQRARRCGGDVKVVKGFALQKQMNEVIRQKNVLETMLLQHKRLRQDRMTIVLDMQRMRADLDRIVNKLDTSLQSLNSTRALCGIEPAKAKQGPIQKKMSHNSMATSKGKGKGKAKSNPIPMNRQTTLANKARKAPTQKKPSPNFASTSHHRCPCAQKAKTPLRSTSMSRQRLRSH